MQNHAEGNGLNILCRLPLAHEGDAKSLRREEGGKVCSGNGGCLFPKCGMMVDRNTHSWGLSLPSSTSLLGIGRQKESFLKKQRSEEKDEKRLSQRDLMNVERIFFLISNYSNVKRGKSLLRVLSETIQLEALFVAFSSPRSFRKRKRGAALSSLFLSLIQTSGICWHYPDTDVL